LLDESRLLRCVIVYMVNGKKMMSGFLWFWLHGKQPRYNYFIQLSSSCALQSLVSYKCHLLLLCCFTVGHSKNFEKTCKGKSKAVGSDGCKTHANPMTVLRTIVHQVLFKWEYPLLTFCCSEFYNIRHLNGVKL
jgi:hypothetical protein